MMSTKPQPDQNTIKDFLAEITKTWHELDRPAQLEMRCIFPGRQPNTARFAATDMGLDLAAEHAAVMNANRLNVYCVINPVRDGLPPHASATDDDIIAARYVFADADDEEGMRNVLSFAGPKFTMSVRTGNQPAPRGHVYWELEDWCLNLPAWRGVQSAIADRLQTDPVVINPSRIMRVAGTVSWPTEKKSAKGYTDEFVTFRTSFKDEREPIAFERLMNVFGTKGRDVSRHDTSGTRAGAVQIDLGQQAMDRAMAQSDILAGNNWHHNVVRLVASYVSKGLADNEIHAITDGFTLAGYTIDDTRREVQQAIDGARNKGFTPPPDPVAERMREQIPQQIQAAPASTQQDDTSEKDAWPTPVRNFNPALLPRRRWIYGQSYIRQYLTVTASAGGIGKTSLVMAEAVAVATGRDLLGEQVHEQTNCWIINLEDPRSEMELRLASVMQHYNVAHGDIAGRLFVDGEDDIEITLAAESREGVARNDALLDYMIQKVKENNIGCVIVDPFVSVHAVNENANVQVQIVVAMLRKLARETDAAVHLVHHVRKGNGDDATVDSVRGANALIGAARAARVINRVAVDDAMRLGFDEREATGIFRVDDAKANLAAPADRAVYRRTIGVQIANGEWIGTVTPLTLPDLFEGVTAETAMLAQRAVGRAAEEDPLRESPQAKRWVGHTVGPIVGVDTSDKAGKARVYGIVKQWIKADVLRVEEAHDGRAGRTSKVVVVGEWIHREEAGL